jgi:NADP-dependent 3-hydroxy acid dehydrogenase YdfG
MKQLFKDKVVIVTGASSGIGEATARQFAINGSKVMLAARSEENYQKSLKNYGHMALKPAMLKLMLVLNLTVKILLKRTVERYGTVNILVNNAGISMRARFDEVNLEVLHRLMNVNFWGTVYCTKYALPYLVASKGNLIGVSSIAGFHGLPEEQAIQHLSLLSMVFLKQYVLKTLKRVYKL